MGEIVYPPARDDLYLASHPVAECPATTHIDYEGFNDVVCVLVNGHPGDWHYFSGDDYQGPTWWRSKTVVEVA